MSRADQQAPDLELDTDRCRRRTRWEDRVATERGVWERWLLAPLGGSFGMMWPLVWNLRMRIVQIGPEGGPIGYVAGMFLPSGSRYPFDLMACLPRYARRYLHDLGRLERIYGELNGSMRVMLGWWALWDTVHNMKWV